MDGRVSNANGQQHGGAHFFPYRQITYWVITPEVGTGRAVAALRASWLKGADDSARFCVASGMSDSHEPNLHWLHGLNRSTTVASGRADLNRRVRSSQSSTDPAITASPARAQGVSEPGVSASDERLPKRHRGPAAAAAREAATAEAQLRHSEEETRRLTRVYNNFLRHKVFEILREMCRALMTNRLGDFAFMMDADTAVNRTNLARFASRIDPSAKVYTGLCKRRGTFSNQMQRGVGGGPGILLSRPLLTSVCPRLEQCAPLRAMMDKLQFAGGDLMIAKCLEFLGHHCLNEREIPTVRAGGAIRNGIGGQRLDDLFRRGPPWVYPPLAGGTILVATRHSAGARAIEQHHRLTKSTLPLSSVISFHRVRPSLRTSGSSKDPRCRVIADYTRLESGPAHWNSRCLPHFLLIGTPKSGTTSLFNWVLQHPDVRAPVRKELHFWAPVLTPEKNCVDKSSCVAFRAASRGAADGQSLWPLPMIVAGRMLTSYLESFPRIDPREYAITGEASPAYLYSPSAAIFLESSLMTHVKMLILLRDPVERTFSEFKNKRDLMVKGAPKAREWIDGHALFGNFTAALRVATHACPPAALYAACKACVRFAAAPAAGSHASMNATFRSTFAVETDDATATRCTVAPVVWQSWYHLFLPRLLQAGPRVLVEFSDDLFDDAEGLMQRVGTFLGLGRHNYSTAIAYNTEQRRGAYISVVEHPQRTRSASHRTSVANQNASVATSTSGNAADASSAAARRSGSATEHFRVVQNLMAHSVSQLPIVLNEESWDAPAQQLRRTLPSSWRKKYLS